MQHVTHEEAIAFLTKEVAVLKEQLAVEQERVDTLVLAANVLRDRLNKSKLQKFNKDNTE